MKRSLFQTVLLVCAGSAFAGAALGRDCVFAAYNVENYAPVPVNDPSKPLKTSEAADAVVRVVKEINPDILGVCEMGAGPQFDDFCKRLAAAGLGYTDFEFVDGPDPDRHLALLSRFPIVSRQSLKDLSFAASGTREKVRRGFLDVAVRLADGFVVRFVGAHLKSKLVNPEDEETLRRNEAHLLRNHVSGILKTDPGLKLVVYGDFNDTKDQPAVQEVAGRRGEPDALVSLALADSEGDRWTHYWKADDVYSRIDYIFVSRALSQNVVSGSSYVYRSAAWNQASDHRPVVATFHPVLSSQ